MMPEAQKILAQSNQITDSLFLSKKTTSRGTRAERTRKGQLILMISQASPPSLPFKPKVSRV